MKKIMLLLAALTLGSAAMAQNDERAPGIYNVNGEVSTPLTFQTGTHKQSNTSFAGIIDIGKEKVTYKGATSDTPFQTAEFALVIDLEKKNAVKTMKKYDVFIKSMTPANMILVPLFVDKGKRIYDKGRSFNGIKFNATRESIEFEWEQITDNSFRITTELIPGEYAFVFKYAKFGGYEFDVVYDFTITE